MSVLCVMCFLTGLGGVHAVVQVAKMDLYLFLVLLHEIFHFIRRFVFWGLFTWPPALCTNFAHDQHRNRFAVGSCV